MKKFFNVSILILSVSLLLSGCKEKSNNSTSAKNNNEVSLNSGVYEVENKTSIDYSDMTAFFTPDFSSMVISEDENEVTVSSTSTSNSSSKQKKSENVIPGLRKLSEYKTKYSTQKAALSYAGSYESQVEEMEKEIASADKSSFKIESWGPQRAVASQSENPTFYVIFSQPVHKIMALEAPSDVSDIMTVEPKLKGSFRWYGSKMLAFEAKEAADPAQSYEISVKKDVKALSGAKLTGQTIFSTKAEEVKYSSIWAGYIKDSEYNNGKWSGGLKPPLDKRYYVRLNYPVTKQVAEDSIKIEIDGKTRSFELEPDYNANNFSWGRTTLKADKDSGRSNSWIVTLNGTVPFNITVYFIQYFKSEYSFETLQSFYIQNVSKVTNGSGRTKKNPLKIRFSQQLDPKSVIGNVTFDFDYTLTEKNFDVNNYELTLFNLPIEKGESHTVTFGSGLKDIYGQEVDLHLYRNSSPLYQVQKTYNFKVSSPSAFTHFLDSGSKIMEAQYPHKLVFEYMNINNGRYKVSATTNPLNSEFDKAFLNDDAIELNPGEKDYNYFEELDLNPYLNEDGYGFVKFQAEVERPSYNSWKERWETTKDVNYLTVQVTDLGVTARVAVNKAVVLVTSIQSGKPIADATVELYGKVGNKAEDIDSTPYATGKTDKNGLAVITYTREEFEKFKTYVGYLQYRSPVVKVINGSDKVLFQPNSHWVNGYDVEKESYKSALKSKQRTFMFVDRGLYRPGETVTFRGIDRTQELGQLVVKHGTYTIKIFQNIWNGEQIGEPIKGTLSESGGFYGTFDVPADMEPGSYVLRYYRDDAPEPEDRWGMGNYEQIAFTVAEFERLKFEAAVNIPDITYYGGDSISATITANYLAGGALNSADYDTNWYYQPVEFTTEIPEAKGYTFGPKVSYSSRNHFSEDKGKLSADGTANIVSKTEKIKNGTPMLYRASADITDLSNQRVSVSNTIMVHPALYYVGLKRTASGFAEKGKKVDVSYLIVDPNGNVVDGHLNQKVQKLEYKLSHKEWKYVNEQSVNNSVYTRYVCEEVEDGTGTIDVKAEKGTFSIVPEKAGWYTLTVTGSDIKNNYVETTLGFYASGSGYSWWGNNSEDIQLTASQSMYNPGDTAQILMESQLPAGDYLITVEREGIFTQEVRHFDSPASIIEIPISKNYVPVVYVSVASYSVRGGEPTHQFGEVDLDKPKGYYGCTPLFINPKVKAFSVKIETDKPTYRPGEEVEVTSTATKGGAPFKNAELSLMAVDRGVLDLINYHVPNPINFFYKTWNYPLSVFCLYTRAMIMDPVTYSVKNLAGGDAEADEEKEEKRKDFRPTAVFEPVVITDKDGKAVVKFKMPDNLTTYRITCFGVSNDLFALNESEVKVQNPVNVSVVKPRKLRERDTAEIGVLLTNLDKDGHKMKVSVEVSPANPLSDTEKGDGINVVPGSAFIDGETEHEVYVASNESSVVYFDIGAEQQGTVAVTFHISSDILNEAIEDQIEITRTYVYETVATMGSLNETEDKGTEQIVIPGFAKDGRGDISLTLDATRLGLLGGGVNYLFEYPYGCLEQQSSRLLPLVIFGDYIDVFGLDSKVTNPKKVVKKYMKQIAKAQKADGGFSYWPNGDYSNYYVSLRLAEICQYGFENGYTAGDLAINYEALLNYIDYHMNEKYNRAYMSHACYVLAKAGRSSVDMYLVGLLNTIEDRDFADICYTGLACMERGDTKGYTNCSELLKQYIVLSNRTVSVTEKNVKTGYSTWTNRTHAIALMLKFFAEENKDDELVGRLVNTLMLNQSHGYWMNTYTTASVLDAIATYIKQYNLDSTDYRGTAAINSKEIMSESFKGAGAKPKTLELPFEGEILADMPRDKALELEFGKKGKGHLFYTVQMTYALPDELQAARDEGLEINYVIRDYETDEIINKSDASTNELNLESGKLYKASITVQTNRNRDYVALRAPIPSGAEILDSTFVTTGDAGNITTESSTRWGHWLSNKVIYDNEIHFFWDQFSTGSATVNYTFRATRRGVYPVPPVQAECMYEPEVFGRSYGYLTEIK